MDTTLAVSLAASLFIFLSPYFFKKKLNSSELSVLVTTLGIFGTFVGIFIGLIGFDETRIDESVPILLKGLRLAFLTSIAGMMASIVLKVSPRFYLIETEDEITENTPVEKMINLLYEVTVNQKALFEKEAEQLKNIEKALCGDGETTLLTQIQKFRTSVSDRFEDLGKGVNGLLEVNKTALLEQQDMKKTVEDRSDRMIKEFQEFAKTMAENNSKSLVEALTEVMRDFNTKINEQFGENFKHLNEGIGKILIWQENYKNHIEVMTAQLEKALEGVSSSERSLQKIREEASSFSNVADSLKELLISINDERNKMKDYLKSFAELSKNAKDALPLIEKEILKLTTDFSKNVEESTRSASNIITSHKDSLEKQSKTIVDTQTEIAAKLSKTVNDINSRIERMMTDNAERVAKQVTELDAALGRELEKSLQSLGNQLASLSQKFANDYGPLTDKLRELINIAKDVK